MDSLFSQGILDLPVINVSDVTVVIKDFLEGAFPQIRVNGEVSNLTKASSGHWYLTLKDDSAQLKAVVWRSVAKQIRFEIKDGMSVIAAGPIQVYEARGVYQLVIEELQPKGIGALELAFRQLQERLAIEGLFDAAHKREIPQFPRRVAIITSPTGAAVQDIIQVITRRCPHADIVVVPVAVQGPLAVSQIVAALSRVHQIPEVDVCICGRGGGSLEDLWAFNEEAVARAIYLCRIPVISAVGHETDVTIADLVADRRALTPSEAGELVVPMESDIRRELHQLSTRLGLALKRHAAQARLKLDAIANRRCFAKPIDRIHNLVRQLDEMDVRMMRAVKQSVEVSGGKLRNAAASLTALSPLGVLERGYSLTKRVSDGELMRDCTQVQVGDKISTLLASGSVISEVTRLEVDED